MASKLEAFRFMYAVRKCLQETPALWHCRSFTAVTKNYQGSSRSLTIVPPWMETDCRTDRSGSETALFNLWQEITFWEISSAKIIDLLAILSQVCRFVQARGLASLHQALGRSAPG